MINSSFSAQGLCLTQFESAVVPWTNQLWSLGWDHIHTLLCGGGQFSENPGWTHGSKCLYEREEATENLSRKQKLLYPFS